MFNSYASHYQRVYLILLSLTGNFKGLPTIIGPTLWSVNPEEGRSTPRKNTIPLPLKQRILHLLSIKWMTKSHDLSGLDGPAHQSTVQFTDLLPILSENNSATSEAQPPRANHKHPNDHSELQCIMVMRHQCFWTCSCQHQLQQASEQLPSGRSELQ